MAKLQDAISRTTTHPLRPALDRTFSVAPMMDWTTRDYRAFARTLTRHALLYTEMVTTGAILHGSPRERFLGYDDTEHPLALQLGGSDAGELAACAAIAEAWGYDEVNLNVGCPSDRVQNNLIGACLMAHPQTVAAAVRAMREAVSIPVTVKCRIGIDDQDADADLARFVAEVADVGCETFIVHARKAWLQGLSPKENRDVPPLDYPRVHRLKRDNPQLHIGINGGIKTLDDCGAHLAHVDSVMIGREAYQNPWLLAGVDAALYGVPGPATSRHAAAQALRPYIIRRLEEGARLNHVTRHLLGLFQGCPGGRRFRRHLSGNAHRDGAGIAVYDDALGLVPEVNEPAIH
ncbi:MULTISPECIES: tRNA dihydrouridine(20/20a) synthase DusA [unclassified Modicisalibacter]|uniref:tRNA dihydrouridine(20/20a) synthase DusA n=1 Tax=unclassified Modicisalibacter TaxID=2679913 RepID=UPI001CCEE321|nr:MULTISPECIES: tRNA dihydrouridine(20/20a) synthase DusA [unclassified Modicisalibacter]MBZ9560279.1 tRNA dihydrouridine(20/20a) synthase DusA [Modicisalibacter sp. R2A 31.J]MBZ9576188.1 tRNA dihydrouridine(20/20a) synthase DusA [Modicisalibacter sp. MOD 31.J]